MYFTHFVTCKNSNKKRACTGNVKIQNTENFWWCTMKVMIQVKFWTWICTIIILYIALIFYYTYFTWMSQFKKKNELGQKIINTCMDIIIIYSSTWQFHPEASYSIKLFETVAHIVLFHSTCSIVTYVYISLSRSTK